MNTNTGTVKLISNAYDNSLDYIIEVHSFDLNDAKEAATVGVNPFKAPYPEAVVSTD